MTLILFILILSLLVLIHEFGHFVAAKKNGIRVEEFGLGLPPKIFGKKVGETTYTLNLLPFGGFVKLTGEDSEEVVLDPKSFAVKKPWQRFTVLVAGVFMNFVLAILLFYVFFAFTGFKTFQLPLFFDYKFKFGRVEELNTIVADVQKDSGADKAGIELGEAVMEVGGVEVKNVKDVRALLVGKQDQDVEVRLVDFKDQASPQTRIVKVKPMVDEEGNPILGVYLTKSVSIYYEKPLEKIFAGFLHSYNVLGYSFNSLAKIIGLSVETKDLEPVSQSVSGPVGIYNIIGSILKYGGSRVWLTIMDYIALMSLSLAAINIMPFPALDGGRLIFILAEWVSGRKVNPKWEANVHKIGMFFLLALIVMITIKDIVW